MSPLDSEEEGQQQGYSLDCDGRRADDDDDDVGSEQRMAGHSNKNPIHMNTNDRTTRNQMLLFCEKNRRNHNTNMSSTIAAGAPCQKKEQKVEEDCSLSDSTSTASGMNVFVCNKRPTTAMSTTAGTVIRSRYLSHLGIPMKQPMKNTMAGRTNALGRVGSIHKQLQSDLGLSKQQRRRSESFLESLKADHGKCDESISLMMDEGCCESSHTTNITTTISTTTSSSSCCSFASLATAVSVRSIKSCPSSEVSFDSTVTLHPIPSRHDYSDRMKKVLWTDPKQRNEDVARNCVEFAAENWDHEQVLLEDDFVPVGDGGDLIHPVHFVQSSLIQQRNFVAILEDQQQQPDPTN